jgi:hypothetical protein
VFRCYPDDEVQSFADLAIAKDKQVLADYPLLRDSVRGHLVRTT